ncbi:hypothetical protein ACLB2K_016054 [Fragaria x ananassa]
MLHFFVKIRRSLVLGQFLFVMAASSSSRPSKHDVFLNFRGEDTRKRFVGHLYNALKQKRIYTFYDSRGLSKGSKIWAVLKAIEDSRLSIVVFSENYGGSTWCLRELARIVECMDERGHIVVPIFYEVDPSHIRKLEGNFAAAFEKYDRNSEIDKEEVKKWKSALTEVSNISGWDSRKYEDDSELIINIVEEISNKLINISSSKADDLVGMDYHIREMNLLLSLGVDDVRYIAIWGPGGLGKSTIARATCDKISGQFDHYCILEDVAADFNRFGTPYMKERLRTRILGNFNTGSEMVMMERLGRHKILLLLDGVESSAQIEKLLGRDCSFASGSRIVITTRDKRSLTGVGAYKYCPNVLNDEEARDLLVQSAFNRKLPTEEFDNLLTRAIVYAQGLPLALKVLGALLHNKTPVEWEEELDKLRKYPHQEIQRVLVTSYDGLDPLQKKIFLDIACFFRGMDRGFVTKILESCGFCPIGGLRVLLERALVTLSCNNLEMPNSLQEVGWEIVRQESNEVPGRRSRLWSYEDVDVVLLTQNTATKAVECITLDLSNSSKVVFINAEAFVEMTGLRLLKIIDDNHPSDYQKQHVTGDFKFLSHELRCLIWIGCPLNSLPFNFDSKNLVYLDMSYSCIEKLWEGTEVHKSISALKNLVLLRLKDCKELVNLPSSIDMKYLKILDLSGCSKLVKFPEISGSMKELSEVYLDETAIKELPSSIERLQDLTLSGCSMLYHLPENMGCLASLRKLEVEGSVHLNLSDCDLWELSDGIAHLSSLKTLDLRRNNLESLPESMKQLRCLAYLLLEACKRLKSIPELSPSINFLDAHDCKALETVSTLKPCYFPNCFTFSNCLQLEQTDIFRDTVETRSHYQENNPRPLSLSFNMSLPGSNIPDWFNHRSKGCSVTAQLPNNWFHNKILGFAICAVSNFKGSDNNASALAALCSCTFRGNHGDYKFKFRLLDWGFEGKRILQSDHMFLGYVPWSDYHLVNTCCHSEASFVEEENAVSKCFYTEATFEIEVGNRVRTYDSRTEEKRPCITSCGVHFYHGDFMELQNLNTAHSQSHHDSCEPLSAATSKRKRERGRRANGSLLTVESATNDSFHP